ncbi:M28 family peptidase [Rubrivirga sp. IMCC45206]|uniref:M28 family peptidase n=1 Tax=Rubrivirga sp. IMCC45206 TaxID=3391614 RepID=UPI00398FB908
MIRVSILALAALAACASPPPPTTPEPTPVALLVDPVALMADVLALADDALEGRRAGTPGGARAADAVERRLRRTGARPAFADGYRQPVVLPQSGGGTNIVARVEGTVFPQQAILVTAHFDGLGVASGRIFNGADDNASGVATLAALADYLRRNPPQHTVYLAALDAEEQGLVGAQALAADPPVPLGAVLAVVNLDMVSRGDLWAAGAAHYPHLGQLLRDAGLPLRFGHDTGGGADNWTSASDHAAFHQRGVPFVYFGVEDHPDYHQPTDDASRIDPLTFARAADTIVRAVEILDASHAALVEGR